MSSQTPVGNIDETTSMLYTIYRPNLYTSFLGLIQEESNIAANRLCSGVSSVNFNPAQTEDGGNAHKGSFPTAIKQQWRKLLYCSATGVLVLK